MIRITFGFPVRAVAACGMPDTSSGRCGELEENAAIHRIYSINPRPINAPQRRGWTSSVFEPGSRDAIAGFNPFRGGLALLIRPIHGECRDRLALLQPPDTETAG